MQLPTEPKPEELTALIDNREQLPLDLSPLQAETTKLDTGDYSLKGMKSLVTVERKSLPDMVQCVGRERERFERCVQRLLAFPHRLLVIEASWEQLHAGGWRGSVTPKQTIGSILSWQAAGLPVLLCHTHQWAGEAVSRFLYITARRRWREARALVGVQMGVDQAAENIAVTRQRRLAKESEAA